MSYECEVCHKVFKNAGALGSHKREHSKKPKPKLEDVLEQIADRLADNPSKPVQFTFYRCPVCGSNLVVMPSGGGTFILKCPQCWEER